MAKSQATTIKFKSKVLRPAEGGEWTFLRLPKEASEQVPTRNTKFVRGALNGFPFEVFLRPDSEGGHWLRIEREVSASAKIAPGETVTLEITPQDDEPETE